MRKKILLIGMPGSGKSTLGQKIAQKCNFNFIDTDRFIEEQENRTLQEIINKDGIEQMQKIEKKYLLKMNFINCVIATGGSAIYYDKIMEKLKKESLIFFLNVNFAELLKRINNFNNRGIIIKDGQTFENLFNQRLPLYKKYADFTIKNDKQSLDKIVEKITAIYNKNA